MARPCRRRSCGRGEATLPGFHDLLHALAHAHLQVSLGVDGAHLTPGGCAGHFTGKDAATQPVDSARLYGLGVDLGNNPVQPMTSVARKGYVVCVNYTLRLALTRADKLLQLLGSRLLLRAFVQHRVAVSASHRSILAQGWKTVIDIGANRGQFALAARRWAPQARLVCFEPLTGPASVFRKVFADDREVTLHEIAIGPLSAQTAMHVSKQDDSSSLLPITELQDKMFPGTAETGTTTVTVEPLQQMLTPADIVAPALLKIDVQGFELQALKGCETLLSMFDCVYAECSFLELYSGQALAGEVISYLEQKGFQFCGVFNVEYDHGRAIQGDFQFRRKRLAAP